MKYTVLCSSIAQCVFYYNNNKTSTTPISLTNSNSETQQQNLLPSHTRVPPTIYGGNYSTCTVKLPVSRWKSRHS